MPTAHRASASRSRLTSCATTSECPPSSVNTSASTDSSAGSSPSTCAHRSRSITSEGVAGGVTGPAAAAASRRPDGAGSRVRSTLPLTIAGSAGSRSTYTGTM